MFNDGNKAQTPEIMKQALAAQVQQAAIQPATEDRGAIQALNTSAADLLNDLYNIENRVTSMRDRLFGPQPEGPSTGESAKTMPSSEIEAVWEVVSSLNETVHRIKTALTDLERL